MSWTDDFDGSVVLVTGGTSGIGKSVVKSFARHGAEVLFCARRADRGIALMDQLSSEGLRATFIQADMADANSVGALIDQVVRRHGRLDHAVNNAAISLRLAPLPDMDETELNDLVDVNVKGVIWCCKYELAQMRRQGAGTIVNIASAGGATMGIANLAAYCATKHAVLGLTRALAVEHAAAGICVNAVSPGPTESEMLNDGHADFSVSDYIAERVPMGRAAQPEEVAAAVLWLSSAQTAYVTGINLPVDGGRSSKG